VGTLDNFRKDAKRWLKVLRANEPDDGSCWITANARSGGSPRMNSAISGPTEIARGSFAQK
jgi:hypothetical protein